RLSYMIDGEPRKADPSVTKEASWTGPRRCISPAMPSESSSSVYNSPSSTPSPGAPEPGSPHNSPASRVSPGAFASTLGERLSPDPSVAAAAARMEDEARKLAEQRHKLELENMRAEFDRKLESERNESKRNE